MKCLVHINNFVVKENNDIYDFLDRMFPTIKELYYRLYFLQKFLNSSIKEDEINKVNEEINKKLSMLDIPEYIVFIEKDGEYTEPISGTTFKLIEKHLIKEIDEKEMLDNLLRVNKPHYDFLRVVLPKFKKIVSNQKEKIK